MMRKAVLVLVLCIMAVPVMPTNGFSRPRGYHYYPPPPVHYRHYHHRYHDDAWAWGLAGLVVGGLMVAAISQPTYSPPPQRVVYVEPPPRVFYQPVAVASGTGQIFTYPPNVPPGMCRWERPVFDQYGRPVLTQSGMQAKEYTLGSCQYAPTY